MSNSARNGEDAVGLHIGTLPTGTADDDESLVLLGDLVNEVYSAAEEGLWIRGTSRTTRGELAQYVRDGEIVVALAGGDLAGCMRLYHVDDRITGFAMLAVPLNYRGTGVGRELVEYAERACAASGRTTMQLEVLVPRRWTHPSKEFLVGWYTRIGYRTRRVGDLASAYPELAPSLATECDFVVFQKDLIVTPNDGEQQRD
jgi:GNAT superfamily N-acetyltransferase